MPEFEKMINNKKNYDFLHFHFVKWQFGSITVHEEVPKFIFEIFS